MEIGEPERETENLEGAEKTLISGVPISSFKFTSDEREAKEDEDDSQQPVSKGEITDSFSSNPQDIPNPVTSEVSGKFEGEHSGNQEAQEEVPLRQSVMQQETGEEQDEFWGRDKEVEGGSQNEVGKEERMNGDSGLRREGAGRRGRSRNSGGGSTSEQCSQTTSSSTSPSYLPKGSLPSSGGRHKQTRRRNHHHHQGRGRRRMGTQLALAFRELLSESLSPWCMSCIHMMVELIVTVTHHCGVCVETGAVVLYDLGSQLLAKVTDVPGMKADAERTLDWVRDIGGVLIDKGMKSMRGAQQVSVSFFGLLCAVMLLGTRWAKSTLVRLGGERAQRGWAAIQASRVWRRVASLVERIRGWFKRRVTHVPPPTPESPGGTGRFQAGQELERLLALALVPEDELDPFTVLGVEAHATEAELKRAYRQLAVQVHPDKNKHPRAGEAFKVLRAAWDVVSNPETRREYEIKRMATTELSKSMNEFLTKLQDDLKEAMNTMMCTKCEGKHKRFEMNREPAEARFCAECNRRHSAEEGDLWAESSMLGLRITYFACMDGKVYDITEWAGCQRIGISPDTHRVPYHISFGSKNNGSSTRHRTPSEHPPGPSNPADLQDFFNRIFQGGPPSDLSANGGFFPSGPPPHHPSGAGPSGPFSPPPPQTGFFMPGGQRPEPSETWTETGKPPRRRKKVRKPFQR